jgi:tetratricopeptide (TPR) repeat protein
LPAFIAFARSEPGALSFASGLLAGRYRLEAELGQGGMGIVYKAHDNLLKRDVAIKVVSSTRIGTGGRARLLREARAAASLNHPNIVIVYDVGEAVPPGARQVTPFIVMELVQGESLRAAQVDSPAETMAIGRQICAALEQAHAGGIIHRDLKPENVLLTPSRTVKLMDFGVAHLASASQLTQEGSFIGTYSYLAPELIMGEQATVQTDLYALGILLYELSARCYPFRTESTAAVLSQHLYAPVDPPSVHNGEIPPELDALIIQLLSKQPEQRPAAAADVKRALDQISSSSETPDSEPVPVIGLEPQMGGRTSFVGRDTERDQLRHFLNQATRGQFGLVMLNGEPGVGKTRLAMEAAADAQNRGFLVLTGHCYDMEGGAPYVAFTEIMEEATRSLPAETVRAALGDSASEVAKLTPHLSRLFADLPASLELSPERARHHLFNGVADFLKRLAAERPLMLIVEDLHWADNSTLLMLKHIALRSNQQSILILVTCRDAEMGPDSPLAQTMEEFIRHRVLRRLPVQRLSEPGVKAMLQALSRQGVPEALVQVVFNGTAGNPFFVEEVYYHLSEEQRLLDSDGRWATDLQIEKLDVPESVRLVIERRLRRITEESRRVLTVASVVGQTFTYGLLQQLVDMDMGALLDVVDVAEQAQLVSSESIQGQIRLTFAHELIRQTLLSGTSLARRQWLHLQIGEAIERLHQSELQQHAVDLAYHFQRAGSAAKPEKLIKYLGISAEQAEATSAWLKAASIYRQILEIVAADNGDLIKEAELQTRLGTCSRIGGEVIAAGEAFQRAFDLYRHQGHARGMAHVALEALQEGVWMRVAPAKALADQALAANQEAEPVLRAKLIARRAYEQLGFDPVSNEAAQKAMKLAAELDLLEIQSELHDREAHRILHEARFTDALPISKESFEIAEKLANREMGSHALTEVVAAHCMLGALDDALASAETQLAYGTKHHVAVWPNLVKNVVAGIAYIRRDMNTFETMLSQIPLDYPLPSPGILRAVHLAEQGELEGAKSVLDEIPKTMSLESLRPFARGKYYGLLARIELILGDEKAAHDACASWRKAVEEIPQELGMYRLIATSDIDEALVLLEDDRMIRAVYDFYVFYNARTTWLPPGSLDHRRGDLALHLDLLGEAERHYRTGLDWTERQRCFVEAGRCLHGLAKVAERRGDRAEATKLLDHAAGLFKQHGTQLYLDKVVAERNNLMVSGK